ncbi:hypothetical protein FRB95_011587 [Tulasnella sp. JGI-2019a]|nr:hypothetical protein FRB93_004812 [Tulasnella sp. JGI-2019a]KAG9035292.1 hypothetical protein FRB95_011587 [Tulasnella sp. JGI-2019a]
MRIERPDTLPPQIQTSKGRPPMSTLSASSEDFSILSTSHHEDLDARSRSSTQSYDLLDETSDGGSVSAISFSDVGSPRVQSGSMSSSQVFSISTGATGDDDDGEDFILVPPSSILRPSRSISDIIGPHPSTPTPARTFTSYMESDEDDEDEKILVQRSPSVLSSTQHRISNAISVSPRIESVAEEAPRARQRMLWQQYDTGADEVKSDGGDDSDEEAILFTGLSHLSLNQVANSPLLSTTIHPISSSEGDDRFPSTVSSQSSSLSNLASARENATTPTLRQPATITPLVANFKPRVLPDLDLSALVAFVKPKSEIHNPPQSPTASQLRSARRKRAKLRAQVQAHKLQQQPGGNHSDDTGSSSSASSYTSGPTTPNAYDDSGASYEEAVRYVTAYLKDPPRDPSPEVHLHFLQSLIIELGLLHKPQVELPTSAKSAKALLKSQVYINVREYVDCRTQLSRSGVATARSPNGNEVDAWLGELKKLMFPSRAALTRSLYKRCTNEDGVKIKPVTAKWIKSRGLGVFLVSFYN